MRRWPLRVLTCLLFVAMSTPALAQRTTGTIFGVATDESGAILPGVTVTLKGAGVAGSPSMVTTGTGAYRFPNLPPGTYNLTFGLQGFATINREEIPVGVGTSVEINVTLKLSTVAETITVTGESPVINTASTQLSTNLNHDWVTNAPQRRFTFFDLINQAGGVSPNTSISSRSQSFGSGTTSNSYQLDGTDFTAPFTGAAWPWPNTDAIQEVEVLSLGASAEYGNVQGAVFNVVTRQGSNVFHGDGNFYYQHQRLTSRNTTAKQDDGKPYHRAQYRDTTWQLAGPVVKDKFWFFGSFQYQHDWESQPGTDPAFPARFNAKRVFYKLNWQISQNNRLMNAYHDDYYDIPGRATALTAPSTISVEHGHNPSPNLTFTSVLSNRTFIEARYSGFYGKDHSDPLQKDQPRVKHRFIDLDTNRVTGGIYLWYDGDSWKSGFNGKVSHFADSFLGGSHDVKLGIQYNEGGSDYIYGYNDRIYTYGTVPAYGYTQVPFHIGGQMRAIGGYADDTYRLGNRVTLNLGVRYDYSQARFRSNPLLDAQGKSTGKSSPASPDLFHWNVVSPRLGVTLKLNESGKSLFKAHYGRYYRGIVTSEFGDATPSVAPQFIFDGVYDTGGNPVNAVKVFDNTNLRVDHNFKDPFSDQFTVGIEQELVKDLGLQVSYVHKRGEDYGAWQDIAGRYVPFTYVDSAGREASGQSFTLSRLTSDPDARLFLLTNPKGIFMRYDGLFVQATKRLSHNWQMTGSIVYSKSRGRLGSSRATPLGGQSDTAGGFGKNPNDFVNTEGRLIGDRPVVAKLQVVYNLPWGFLVGANYTHQTGRLWSRQVRVGGLGFPSRPTINMEANTGNRRVANWDLIDLRIQKDFKFTKDGANVAFFGDVLNLTNTDANESILSRRGDQSTFGQPSRFLYPRRLMVGAKIRF